MRNYQTTTQLSVILILAVILLASSVGATPPDWRTRQGTVGWALSLQDGTHVYLDAVIIDKIRASIPDPYFTIRECFYAADRLVILSRPSTFLRMGQLIDIEGDLVTLPNGDRGLQNVTVWGYTDKDGVLLTRGGPLCKGIWNRTTWDYMVNLTVSSSVRAATEPSSNDEPNTDPAERPSYYPNISDILETESAQTQGLRTQSYYDGIPDVRGLPDGSLVALECKGITAAGTENIGGTDYNYFDMIENPPATDTIRCYYSGTASVTDRVNKITGQIRHVGTEPVICVDTGPDYDPQILEGGGQLVSQGSLAWVKSFPDGTQIPAGLEGKVVSGDFYDLGYFFIQEPNKASGIRVDQYPYPWWWFSPGDEVAITSGQVTTIDNQRVLVVDPQNIEYDYVNLGPIGPLGLNNRAVAGGPFNIYTPGATDAFGLNNVGLLIKTWGKASDIQTGYFYISDGSDNIGVKVDLNTGYYNISHNVQAGDYAAVTGIVTLDTINNQQMRVVKPRDSSDIQLIAAVLHFTNITVTPNKAGVDETVSISFYVDQTLAQNPTVTVNGHPATLISGGYYGYTYTYTVLDDDQAGWATIAISGKGSGGLSGSATKLDALWITDTTFDDNGNRRTMRDSRGVTYYEYDVLGRLTKVIEPDGKWIAYEYDARGNRTKMTDQFGGITRYDYTDRGLLWHITDRNNGVTSFSHYPNGKLRRIDYPNGTHTEYSYDGRGNILTLNTRNSSDVLIAGFTYEYNTTTVGKKGIRTAITENLLKPDGSRIQARVEYDYDHLYRLVGEHRTGDLPYDKTYSYDSAGNRLTVIDNGITTSYSYDTGNRMLAAGNATFVCDDAGNTVSKTIGSVTTTYSYDLNNMMTSVSEYELQYSGSSRLVSTPEGHVYEDPATPMAQAVLFDTDSSDIIQRAYIRYGMYMVGFSMNSNAYCVHSDILGSIKVITDSSGNVVGTQTFDAFGNRVATYGTLLPDNSYIGDSGYRSIGTSGLMLLTRRMYSPEYGRFMSSDPVQYGHNWYVYASGNPIMMVDPYGTFDLPGAGIGAGIGCIGGTLWGIGSGIADWLGGGGGLCETGCSAAQGCLSSGITGFVIGLFPAHPNLTACIGSTIGGFAGDIFGQWCNLYFCKKCPDKTDYDPLCTGISTAVSGVIGCVGSILPVDGDIADKLKNGIISIIGNMGGGTVSPYCRELQK